METITHHIWIGFAGGVVACTHCVGMCGGFVLHLSRQGTRHAMLTSQLLWHAGKLFSYLLLGACAGFAGGYFQLFFLRHGMWQNLLSFICAALMFLMGLSLAGLLPVQNRNGQGVVEGMLACFGGRLFSSPAPGASLLLGVVTGFLPCPIILAFIAYSLQTGSVPAGMATMVSLGLGTSLPLMLLGGAARMTRWHLRHWAPKAAGAILIVLATTTLLRGTSIYHRLIGCPPKPVLHLSDHGYAPCSAGSENDHSGR